MAEKALNINLCPDHMPTAGRITKKHNIIHLHNYLQNPIFISQAGFSQVPNGLTNSLKKISWAHFLLNDLIVII